MLVDVPVRPDGTKSKQRGPVDHECIVEPRVRDGVKPIGIVKRAVSDLALPPVEERPALHCRDGEQIAIDPPVAEVVGRTWKTAVARHDGGSNRHERESVVGGELREPVERSQHFGVVGDRDDHVGCSRGTYASQDARPDRGDPQRRFVRENALRNGAGLSGEIVLVERSPARPPPTDLPVTVVDDHNGEIGVRVVPNDRLDRATSVGFAGRGREEDEMETRRHHDQPAA